MELLLNHGADISIRNAKGVSGILSRLERFVEGGRLLRWRIDRFGFWQGGEGDGKLTSFVFNHGIDYYNRFG